MDVIVDGESNFEVRGAPEDLMGVVAAVSDFLREKGRALVTMSVDGENVSPDDLGEGMAARPFDSIERLEATSELLSVLVEDSLKELRDSLPELPVACRRLAEIFHGEAPEEGFDPFQELAGIWGQVKERELMVARAMSLDMETMKVDGTPVGEMHRELNGFLGEAAQAVLDGDCILIGDLLEYELAPRAEQEARIVALLRELAAADATRP